VAIRRKESVLGPLRMLFNVGAIRDMTDGQLLERFASGGEAAELAFAALVERHGPLVLHTCRSILRDDHEAEDAFQATFLVLVRKAGSLWVRDSLGPWLHQVACRAARRARTEAARQADHVRRTAETTARRDHERAEDGEEFAAAIHEEIERMPERYRVPVLLCDLEGRTHEQAARHLGCPVGTIKSRLARGRLRLRDRLTRRGLVVPAGVVAAGLLPPTARAVPPASWVDSTIRAAMQIVAGRPTAAVVSATVLSVVKNVSRELFMSSLKGVVAVVVTLGALAAGTAGLAWTAGGQKAPSDPAAPPQAAAEVKKPKGLDTADIRGSWEVLYMAGTVSGKREGYFMPNLLVPITDKSINLPTLTSNPNDPIHYLGASKYTQVPGRREAKEWDAADEAELKLKSFRDELARLEQAVLLKKPVSNRELSMARQKVELGKAWLQTTYKRLDARWAETTIVESQIDIEAAPDDGKARRGIYRLRGDILTICYDASDQGRPETFVDTKPSESLLILRRGLGGVALQPLPRADAGPNPTRP
jgi:RNA polymerase sigma factor (sigma-70 family)